MKILDCGRSYGVRRLKKTLQFTKQFTVSWQKAKPTLIRLAQPFLCFTMEWRSCRHGRSLRNQLLIYWIQLQALQHQGALCSETHQALTRGHRDVAEATLQLTQYLGRLNYRMNKHVIDCCEYRYISYTDSAGAWLTINNIVSIVEVLWAVIASPRVAHSY